MCSCLMTGKDYTSAEVRMVPGLWLPGLRRLGHRAGARGHPESSEAGAAARPGPRLPVPERVEGSGLVWPPPCCRF